jgi:hypothetical protein
MAGPIALVVIALSALIAARRRRRDRLPARAVIVSPRRSTAVEKDGAVRSVQSAMLTMRPEALERLWHPKNLENLGRTYWLFLQKVTLGLIRVVYTEDERAVVFLAKPLTLLRFEAPDYQLEPDHGNVRWRIRDGLLVAREGHGCGFLALDVRLEPTEDGDAAQIRIEVEVANFYPSIAAGFSTPVYMATQSFIHVLVTHAFLRSLATLQLEQSKIGLLAEPEPDSAVAPGAALQSPQLGPVVPGENASDGARTGPHHE